MPKMKSRLDKRFIAIAALFVVGVYVLLPQAGNFQTSRHLLSHPEVSWLLGAIGFMAGTYLAAAGTYYFLTFKKLKYWRTALVQLAAMFVNRLLPGGVGALGANFIYLKHNRHSAGEASTIVAINNTLGFLGHSILTFLILLVYSGNMVSLDGHESYSWDRYVKYVVLALVLVVGGLIVFGRKKFKKFLLDIVKQLKSYSRQPWKLIMALMTSMLLTSCNVLCLYFCMQAIGVELSLLAVFLIFSLGVSAGTATPTPGGLGGYEAALVAGFVAYGVDGSTALAIALLYRLVSYWLPLLVGSIAFIFSQKRRYI